MNFWDPSQHFQENRREDLSEMPGYFGSFDDTFYEIEESSRGFKDECKYDNFSKLNYGATAFELITESIYKTPGLVRYITRVGFDRGIDGDVIEVYVSSDASLFPPNIKHLNALFNSFAQCSVRVRWLIDFA